ncbi:hypothetical protein CAPTEDRAFT_221605 [Capitella teleta]|uniref:Apple domain-containing protein n=1 Tax=Capitella teleta TaxID=283909 RepID=R7UY09_CAPTE|nr:hypothetical protein CAPTEDRAFT_221605 [Capitella teleta]|eukprot:ELU11468.1 hypothetical protein CAPTEDRAFT_221605 [Capitella teleta]
MLSPWQCTLFLLLMLHRNVAGYRIYNWFNSSLGLSSKEIDSTVASGLNCQTFCLSNPRCWSLQWETNLVGFANCKIFDTSRDLEPPDKPVKIHLEPHTREQTTTELEVRDKFAHN